MASLYLSVNMARTEATPAECRKGIILPLPKKGGRSFLLQQQPRRHPLWHISKGFFFTILLLRVKDEVDLRMRENQAGFRKETSCQDQIFSLHHIIEKCLGQQLPCLISFIDFKAAFDGKDNSSHPCNCRETWSQDELQKDRDHAHRASQRFQPHRFTMKRRSH